MRTNRKQAMQKPPPGIVWIEDYVSEDGSVLHGIATRLGITAGTYRKWRMAGKGPDTFLLGKRVAARIAAVDNWVTDQERAAQEPTDEMRAPEPRISRVA